MINIHDMNWHDMTDRDPIDGEWCYFEVLDELQPKFYTGDNGVWNEECREFRGPKGGEWRLKANSVKRWTYCVEDAA